MVVESNLALAHRLYIEEPFVIVEQRTNITYLFIREYQKCFICVHLKYIATYTMDIAVYIVHICREYVYNTSVWSTPNRATTCVCVLFTNVAAAAAVHNSTSEPPPRALHTLTTFYHNIVFVYLCLYPPFSIYLSHFHNRRKIVYIYLYIYTSCVSVWPNKRVVLINKCYSWNGKTYTHNTSRGRRALAHSHSKAGWLGSGLARHGWLGWMDIGRRCHCTTNGNDHSACTKTPEDCWRWDFHSESITHTLSTTISHKSDVKSYFSLRSTKRYCCVIWGGQYLQIFCLFVKSIGSAQCAKCLGFYWEFFCFFKFWKFWKFKWMKNNNLN